MNEGFTLIETLVAIAIFILIATALFGSVVSLYQTNAFVWQQAQAIDEARRGVKVMIREIREARAGDDGSFAIAEAEDSQFIFYSDIDRDDEVERVRYFLGGISAHEEEKSCVSYVDGGTCMVAFSDFYSGILEQAQVEVSVEGDFGWSLEFAEIFVDGAKLGELCDSPGECSDCPGFWQDTIVFDVTDQAQDNELQFLSDASARVANFCDWQEPAHSMKVQFKLSWTDTASAQEREFKKGVIEPVGFPPAYFSDNEQIVILSRYVQNKADDPQKYVFKYFDRDGQEITDYPARPEQTRLMQISLIVNVNPERAPADYTLESKVQLRNLNLGED
jgi:hypothetical protein